MFKINTIFSKNFIVGVLMFAFITMGLFQKVEANNFLATIPTVVNKFGLIGLRANWAESRPNYCSRFVRQVFQRAFPQISKSLDDKYFGGSAYETESMWARQGKLKSYSRVVQNGGLKEGDVVFQDYPVYGHIGILVVKSGKFFVSENTVRYGMGVRDHRALTPLQRFGKIRSIGRFSGFRF